MDVRLSGAEGSGSVEEFSLLHMPKMILSRDRYLRITTQPLS